MLDDRKAAILCAVVEHYISTAQPVGSAAVASRADVTVSPATVRNEMTLLEREGYLIQPHTSAGRVPTEKGYRFFVDGLAMQGEIDLSEASARQVRDFFTAAHGELEQVLHDTSRLLTSLTRSAAVVVGEQVAAAVVRSVQLVDLSPRMVLLVLVFNNGDVVKRSIELDVDASEDDVAAAQHILNEQLLGRSWAEVSRWSPADHPVPGSIVVSSVARSLEPGERNDGSRVYVEGTSFLAGSLEARETVEQVLGILEQQLVVVTLLKELAERGVMVAIGSETGLNPLADCSVVLSPYRVDGEVAGTVAVLGPTRMDYQESVAAVAVVSQRLTRALTEG
ncbi:MAG: heat-inducible transcriptional repressor HrcA [Actinomycetota bacterium]|jgi:heat-inducible transcriptional repressor